MGLDLAAAEVIARLDYLERELLRFQRSLRQLRLDLADTLDTDDEPVVE